MCELMNSKFKSTSLTVDSSRKEKNCGICWSFSRDVSRRKTYAHLRSWRVAAADRQKSARRSVARDETVDEAKTLTSTSCREPTSTDRVWSIEEAEEEDWVIDAEEQNGRLQFVALELRRAMES